MNEFLQSGWLWFSLMALVVLVMLTRVAQKATTEDAIVPPHETGMLQDAFDCAVYRCRLEGTEVELAELRRIGNDCGMTSHWFDDPI